MLKAAIDLKADSDIVLARQAGRELAQEMGFGSADQTRLATAISELARNVIQYAGEGVCSMADESNQRLIMIRVVVEDAGPGIADLDQAMAQGFSSGAGLGAGLPGARRLVQEFDIESEPGHTRVTIAISRQKQ